MGRNGGISQKLGRSIPQSVVMATFKTRQNGLHV